MGVQDLLAFAAVTGATGVMTVNKGAIAFATFVRNGAGDYTGTLGQGGVDLLEAEILVQCLSGAGIARVVHTSDTVKQVIILDNAGMALDSNFTISVRQIAYGPST